MDVANVQSVRVLVVPQSYRVAFITLDGQLEQPFVGGCEVEPAGPAGAVGQRAAMGAGGPVIECFAFGFGSNDAFQSFRACLP